MKEDDICEYMDEHASKEFLIAMRKGILAISTEKLAAPSAKREERILEATLVLTRLQTMKKTRTISAIYRPCVISYLHMHTCVSVVTSPFPRVCRLLAMLMYPHTHITHVKTLGRIHKYIVSLNFMGNS